MTLNHRIFKIISVGRRLLKILSYNQLSVYCFIRMYLALHYIFIKSLCWFRVIIFKLFKILVFFVRPTDLLNMFY